jgi:hypothetical protein
MQGNREEFKEYLQTRKAEMQSERSFILSKIDDWLFNLESIYKSKSEIKQKRKEIIDFGKFIYCFNQDIKIVNAFCESPDILISLDEKLIGVELTDLVIRNNEKEKEGLLQKLFTQIEEELEAESDKYNGIYSVEFIDSIDLNSKNQKLIKKEIKEIIQGEISFGNLVTRIHKSFNTNIHLYDSEASVVGPLTRDIVEERILRKEKNLFRYSSKNYNEIWLLLVMGGVEASDNYSFIDENVTSTPFKTSYTKIFLLNFFDSEIIELQTIN